MPKLIKRDRGNYTNVSNIVVRDSRLSWKARGIFLYLWSQANEWQFYVSEVATHATDGEDALRSGLKELEQYGYLERTPAKNEKGAFNGLLWILQDKPEIDDQHSGFPDDGEIQQKAPKKTDLAETGKTGGRKTRTPENPTLRNNNNKNYQYKELTTNKKSSSSSSKEHKELKDPFAEAVDDDEKVVKGLISLFLGEARIARPAPYEYKNITDSLLALGQAIATVFMYRVINKVSTSNISDPVAYLERSLMNAKGGEANG